MSERMISVEGLSKKYIIDHQVQRQTYKAFRDVITNNSRGFAKRLLSLSRQRQAGSSARQEKEEFWALKDVSFEVNRGEVLGVVGRNGAGKSTLLKILSRITEPTQGRVRLQGRVASLLEVGTGFHPELTGRENVFLNGSILGMARTEIVRKFDEIVAFAGVERFLDTPVKRYSSGMYVRLAFAVAAHLEPEILIVDEVLAVGDAQFQKKCMGKMQDVATGAGRTVIFVSHNMAAVNQLCDRAILLRSGSMALDGLCEEVTSRYLDDAVEYSNGWVDLTSHPGRSASSKAIITAVAIRNSQGGLASQIFPDEAVEFEIHVNSADFIEQPRIAMSIEDNLGRRLMTFSSYFQENDRDFSVLKGKALIKCRIEGLSLGPGRYLCSVSVSDRDARLLDSIDGAFWFDVLWNNNYANNEPYHSVYGPVLGESSWQMIR